MNGYLPEATYNPQLLKFQNIIELSDYAFVVQCSTSAAEAFLKGNPSLLHPKYTELEELEVLEEVGSDRETPCVDIGPIAWLFPKWKPKKQQYVFGTRGDIVLPRARHISRKDFELYLAQSGVWMIRNLSRTIDVNGEPLGVQLVTSLNPDLPNHIQTGNFECIIHPIYHPPTAAKDDGLGSLSFALDIYSDGTLTTSSAPISTIDRTSYVTREAYHYLQDRKISVQGDAEVLMAIRKITGQNCIAKMYSSKDEGVALRQYEMMVELRKQPNIVPYDGHITRETGPIIITPHYDALPLDHCLEPQGRTTDVELAFIVHKHISSVLICLKDIGITHRNINEHTILVGYQNDEHTAYLTGFSEYASWDADSEKRDMRNLTSIIEKLLPGPVGYPSCDPQWRSLMLQTREGNITASQLCIELEVMAPDYKHIPFKTFHVTRETTIQRVVDQNGTQAVRLLDFLRLVLHHRPEYWKETELGIRKVVRKTDLFQIKGEDYCHLHYAKKLLSYIGNNIDITLIDLEPPSHTEACWYKTKHSLDIPISYHKPTGLVNITQMLNLFDTVTIQQCVNIKEPLSQEIRGSPQWEGFYIDKDSATEIMRQLSLKHTFMNSNKHTILPGEFFGNQEKMVIVVTEEMVGHILVDRHLKSTVWHDEKLSIETAKEKCKDHGLTIAYETLCRVTEHPERPERTWKSHYTDEDMLNLVEHSDQQTATSHNSDQTQERDRLVRKRRKVNATVPLLPPWRTPTRQSSSTEKVSTWIDAGPNIRSTKFGTRRDSRPK